MMFNFYFEIKLALSKDQQIKYQNYIILRNLAHIEFRIKKFKSLFRDIQ